MATGEVGLLGHKNNGQNKASAHGQDDRADK